MDLVQIKIQKDDNIVRCHKGAMNCMPIDIGADTGH